MLRCCVVRVIVGVLWPAKISKTNGLLLVSTVLGLTTVSRTLSHASRPTSTGYGRPSAVKSFQLFFTARSSYASAVVAIVILSVCLSVRPSVCHTRALWQTIEHTADILIPHERVIILVFCYQKRLVGDDLFHLTFALKVTHPSEKHWLRPISAYNVLP